MYLVVIHIPVYVDGLQMSVTTEWKQSLILLRDSLNGRLGPITILSPKIENRQDSEQILETISDADDIHFIPSIDTRGSSRDYWMYKRKYWNKDVSKIVRDARVVHAGLDQLWKPIMFEGFLQGLKQNKTTIFVADTDVVFQMQELFKNAPFKTLIKNKMYCYLFEKVMRWSVERADLSLLKGGELQRRYGTWAKNAKDFHDTSFTTKDIIEEKTLDQRLSQFLERKSLKLVYAGRFEERKGLKKSLEIISKAVHDGLDVYYDLIGGGREQENLEKLTKSLNLEGRVRFHGMMPYGKDFFKQLSTYDAMLFTPLAEDTPRMIFDGFAAGLPLISTPIPYTEEIIRNSQTGILLYGNETLLTSVRDRTHFVAMSRKARKEAQEQAANVWYQKRAEWTLEAVKVHEAKI